MLIYSVSKSITENDIEIMRKKLKKPISGNNLIDQTLDILIELTYNIEESQRTDRVEAFFNIKGIPYLE